jgi:hypothetical protein
MSDPLKKPEERSRSWEEALNSRNAPDEEGQSNADRVALENFSNAKEFVAQKARLVPLAPPKPKK